MHDIIIIINIIEDTLNSKATLLYSSKLQERQKVSKTEGQVSRKGRQKVSWTERHKISRKGGQKVRE